MRLVTLEEGKLVVEKKKAGSEKFCILVISTKFVTGSIHVRALNVNSWLFAFIFHGPIKSTATLSHGTATMFRGGR